MESDERRYNALDFLLDYSKGTLWWVDNAIWGEAIPGFLATLRKGNRHHPGLSVAYEKAAGLCVNVPMVIGTSRPNYGMGAFLEVRHINEENSAHRETPGYFSVLRPRGLKFDDFGRAGRIVQNRVKPRLDADEAARLDALLKRKEV